MRGSVPEDFFERKGLDRTEGAEILGVKILDVAKDSVMICAAFNQLILNLLYILKGEGLEHLIHLLRTLLCKAEFASAQIAGKDTIACDSLSTEC